ncbi:MAG TPA: GtrA family protein [Xanthobacteraceae bacterium]|jgi:putative flippase GtrA|nr:GtrA family protein [Xanthobacteraceae bacterium]
MWLPPPFEALSYRVFPDPGRRAVALKAVSFALVGVINASVDFGVFSFFYFYLGFPIVAANLISWLVAVTGSYVMNSMTTFAAESGRKLRLKSYATFLLAQVAGLVANTATVYLVPKVIGRILGIDPALTSLVLIGKLLAIGSSFLVNFSLSHFVVFRHRGKSATH